MGLAHLVVTSLELVRNLLCPAPALSAPALLQTDAR
jgi:hypothetical protein